MVADAAAVQIDEDTSEEIPIPEPGTVDPDCRPRPASWLHWGIPSEHTSPCGDDGVCDCFHCAGEPCDCDECDRTGKACRNCLYDPFCKDCHPC